MTSSSHFKLISTATAVALIAPDHLQPEINSLRKIHDKAFRKWDPHINLLYPFVEPSQLSAAVSILRQHIHETQTEKVNVELSRVDLFKHRRNATVFLRPSLTSEEKICQLRASLAACLGCAASEGTHDGTFRPHMTIGQAGFIGPGIERLTDKVEKLKGVNWASRNLVVLKREPSGEMKVVEELPFGLEDDDALTETLAQNRDRYNDCFSFSPESGWSQFREDTEDIENPRSTKSSMTIASYNLMAEPSAPSFSSRLPLVIEAISSAITRSQTSLQVLCLQEVNEEMLPLLLADPFIQKTYPFSSHSPSSLLPSYRNVVSLSSAPFRSLIIAFKERHKSMLAISFTDVEVINVHLSSALSDQSVKAKMQQMKTITDFAQNNKAINRRHFIVAGDFNLTTSSYTVKTALSRAIITPSTAQLVTRVIDRNFWEDAFEVCNLKRSENVHDDDSGSWESATFDRSSNPLAALSEPPIDKSPQRYDRILYQKGGSMKAEHFERFGLPNEYGKCASDHYGVLATLRIAQTKGEVLPTDSQSRLVDNSKLQIIDDLQDLPTLISAHLPSQEDRNQREQALQLLHQTLSKDKALNDLIVAPLGSYLMDTYFADSDIDVLVIASISPQAFFHSASTQLHSLAAAETGNTEFKGVHFVNSLVSIIELIVMGIKFDVQYCQARELIESYRNAKPIVDLATLVFDPAVISKLSPSSLRPLNTYRDTAYLLKTSPDISSYRIAHRFLSLYLKRRGLYSAKFGYLGGIHLSLMLSRVFKLIPLAMNAPGDPKPTPAIVIRTFFKYYATFSWATEIVTDPGLDTKPTRTARDAVFIHTIHTPTARPNVASSCTRLSGQTFSYEFSLAAKMLDEGNWDWCLQPRAVVVSEFLNTFGAFVRISVDIWDINDIGGDKGREVVGGLESKMTRLLVGLGRLPNIDARIWPARFRSLTEKAKKEDEENTRENQFKGYYLVGVSAREEDTEQKKLLTGKIIATVRDFETSVKDSKEFQGENVWLSMDLVPKKKITEMNLSIDERDWGAIPAKMPLSQLDANMHEPGSDNSKSTLSLPPQNRIHYRSLSSSGSLRPAQDIISRIKWDPNLQVSDYLIGYEDRFLGVKEVELGKWKSEQTDEEFIPMHRIVWVRQKGSDEAEGSSGVKVWDRRKRVDLIFGSGKGVGNEAS